MSIWRCRGVRLPRRALTLRQDVELIDPVLSERDNADEPPRRDGAPDLAANEKQITKIAAVFVRCVQSGKPGQSLVECCAHDARRSIHVRQGQAVEGEVAHR